MVTRLLCIVEGIFRLVILARPQTPVLYAAVVVVVVTASSVGFVYYASTSVSGSSVSSRSSVTQSTIESTIVNSTSQIDKASVQLVSVQIVSSTVGATLDVNVTFRNTGNVPIEYYYYGGTGINFTVSPQGMVTWVPSQGPSCGIPAFAKIVQPGATLFATWGSIMCNAPGQYKLVAPGTITVTGTFEWWQEMGNQTSRFTAFSQNFVIHH